jgi:antitoxin (DNA-binding transcriptional repressor) of toxin-antitoxin stability system
MRKVGLLEAKQRFWELADWAARGERIGITKRGKLIAEIGPVRQEGVNLKEVFERIEKIRRKVKPHPGITAKDLIEEGRR